MNTTRSNQASAVQRLEVRALGRSDWPIIERLFGENGACGGCWCMWWRVPQGGKLWAGVKGERNRRAFRELVTAGKADGLLAFEDGEAVGWCALGPRSEFPRTERIKAVKSAWDSGTWSVNCFFIPARHRGRGVASALLRAAVAHARRRGAKSLEGYPLRPTKRDAAGIPAAFAWTGVVAMFDAAGFECTLRAQSPREVWSKRLGRASVAPRPSARRLH